jgi:hypothetical protein
MREAERMRRDMKRWFVFLASLQIIGSVGLGILIVSNNP